MRGTPLDAAAADLVFLIVLSGGANIGGYKFTAIILGCSLNYAAYFAEIYPFRYRIDPDRQYEAAQLLGYHRVQTFFKIVSATGGKNQF